MISLNEPEIEGLNPENEEVNISSDLDFKA